MNKLTPLISFILPSIKVDWELMRCISSIHLTCENYCKYEIILVLPSSEIETCFIKLDSIVICQESSRGIYSAMNDGIATAQGDYLYFIGKDDVLLNLFRNAIKVMTNKRAELILFDVYWGDKGIFKNRPNKLLLLFRNICHQGIIYSRELMTNFGLYDERMRVQADHFFNICIFWNSYRKVNLIYIKKPLVWYSDTGYSSQSNKDEIFYDSYPGILEKYLGRWAKLLIICYRYIKSKNNLK